MNNSIINNFAQKINEKEKKSNKVTALSSSVTDSQYPSAKAVYDAINNDYGSFAELQNLINNTAIDGTLILDKDYKNTGNEENITITQNITIIGNGHTIDADSHNNIITINGELTVKPSFHDVIFLNGVNEAEDGGAICSIENVDISNCSFINCSTSFGGGAVGSYGNVTIKDSIFINCTANDDGGAVRSYDGEIQDCLFINNHANFNGGAVYLISPTKHIKNSLFVNNTALNEGGGVSSANVNNYEVYNCTFDQISTLHNTVNVSYITSSSVPSASSSTPSADTTNGSVGTGTTWARSDHTHPKSSLYAESTHTHEEYIQNQEFYFDGDDFVIISNEQTITKTLIVEWNDNNDARGLRPRYLQVTINDITAYLSEESEWSVSIPVDTEDTYTWSVPSVLGYMSPGYNEVDNVLTVTFRIRTQPTPPSGL